MIYFVEDPATRLIKIGFTDSLPRRMKQLVYEYRRPGCPCVRLLGVMEGDRETEFSLHQQFGAWRFGRHTEWFSPCPELTIFIQENTTLSGAEKRTTRPHPQKTGLCWRIHDLMEKKSEQEGRRISYQDISRATNMRPKRISELAQNRADKFYGWEGDALCEYFSCSVNEILVIVR